MRTRLTRKPGQKGTKELTLIYGEKLVCVRYRYDTEKKRRYKTVEIIVEESEWIPNDALVLVKVAWGEQGISYKVKKAGGIWNKSKQAWELRYDKVVELQLEDRLLNVRSKFTDKDKLCHTVQYDQRQAKRTLYRTGR